MIATDIQVWTKWWILAMDPLVPAGSAGLNQAIKKLAEDLRKGLFNIEQKEIMITSLAIRLLNNYRNFFQSMRKVQNEKVMLVFETRPEAKMCPLVNELKQHDTIRAVVVTGRWKCWTQVLDVFVLFQTIILAYEGQSSLVAYWHLYQEKNPWCPGAEKTWYCPRPWRYHDTLQQLCGLYGQSGGVMSTGLRTYNLQSPYPEEFNPSTTSMVIDYNLLSRFQKSSKEGRTNITVTGEIPL